MKQFIICTQDWGGLGWAKMLQDEGFHVLVAAEPQDNEQDLEGFNQVGKGIVPVFTMKSIFKNRADFRNAYWLFDQNKLTDYATKLRAEGFNVFGGQELSQKMEEDRNYAAEVAKQYGLMPPPTFEFFDIQSGLNFLSQNPQNAYVFKPDVIENTEQKYLTYVPNNPKDELANKELYTYMAALKKDPGKYILQQRIDGVEANFEVWFYKGNPFFAVCGLESKRKLNDDKGENAGCPHDIAFPISLGSKAIAETVGKLFPFYKEQNYTGFADANVIIADKQNYFLEVCNRFGYNFHPNLFMTLAEDNFGDIISDFIDGKTDNFYSRFKYGFGASITVYVDHKRPGIPIFVDPEVDKNFYCYDYYLENGQLLLAGYSFDIGIISAHGYTIKDAGEKAVENSEKISFPDKGLRTDIAERDYPSSPIGRYEALQAMKYI